MKHLAQIVADNLRAAAREVAEARQQPHGPRFNLLAPRIPSVYRVPKRLAKHARRCQSCGKLTFAVKSRCSSPTCPSGHVVCPRCSDTMDEQRTMLTAIMREERRREEDRQFAALLSRGPSTASH